MTKGAPLALEQFRFTASNGVAMVSLVRRGLGIGIVPHYALAASPDLVPILQDQFSIEIPLWVVAHRELHTSRRIRLVFDALAEGIANGR